MLLEYYGQKVPEFDLRVLCKCDDRGTAPSDAVAAASHYGFDQSGVNYLTLSELRDELGRGVFPIVYLSYGTSVHAVVVTGVVQESGSEVVHISDPHPIFGGERKLDVNVFVAMWRSTNSTTIIIE